MSTHCNKYPGCGCPPECGERCHIVDLGSPETVGDLLDRLNGIPFNADFGFRNQPAQKLYYDNMKVSCYFQQNEIQQTWNLVESQLPDMDRLVIAKCQYSSGHISHNIIRRIPSHDSTIDWQWSSEGRHSYFALRVIAWKYFDF